MGEGGSRALMSVSGQRHEWDFKTTSYIVFLQVQITHPVAGGTPKTGYGSTPTPRPQDLAQVVALMGAFAWPVTSLFAPTPMLPLPTMFPPVCAEQHLTQQLARVTRECGVCRTSTRVVQSLHAPSRTARLRMTMIACVALRLAQQRRQA